MASYWHLFPEGSDNIQAVENLPDKTNEESSLAPWLYGNLEIWLHEANALPNTDIVHRISGSAFDRFPSVASDPYVSIVVSNVVIARTFVMHKTHNPIWNQHFLVPVAYKANQVHFVIKDDDAVGFKIIGAVSIPVGNLLSGDKVEGTYPIRDAKGKQCNNEQAVLTLSIRYTSMEKVSFYRAGVGSDISYPGVPGTYFPVRREGKVKLYQDAHASHDILPEIHLDSEKLYEHGHCWRDMYDAINQACHLVYITGWSVQHSTELVRDDPTVENSRLGELLIAKAQQGVRVLLLVWDDISSTTIGRITTDGIMATGDDKTRQYFRKSLVQVLLCPRPAGKSNLVQRNEAGVLTGGLASSFPVYSHHQKSVMVDVDAGNSKRKIIAFIGGLDLCKGRYDTQHHSLFTTLETVHKDDFYNPTLKSPAIADGCPRQPWHDLHCQIHGPAAYDVLQNFEERWLKASKRKLFQRMISCDEPLPLITIDNVPDILGATEAVNQTQGGDDDSENWHVQVFRSIDSNSVIGFPEDQKEASSKNLLCGKNVLVDMSIHTAYIKAIRAAQHFIYLENQYFIGSSFNWSDHSDSGANNLVPMEIALKIVSKIRARERFSVYIIVPMWPEGDPTEYPPKTIIYWQYKTIQMMYKTIYDALQEAEIGDEYEPQDYLNFFCLGNREDENPTKSWFTKATPRKLTKKNRRFMIYAHSKGMIVDDEYVLMGSANINQRSLQGTRDTEIAMGAYQPHHTWASNQANPHGQIHGYRMSLWAEHMGVLEDCFEQPESLECTRRIRMMSEHNWNEYVSDEVHHLNGHLLKYPLEVDRQGNVMPLPNCVKFPDLGGDIIGARPFMNDQMSN